MCFVEVHHLWEVIEKHAAIVIVTVKLFAVDTIPFVFLEVVGRDEHIEEEMFFISILSEKSEGIYLTSFQVSCLHSYFLAIIEYGFGKVFFSLLSTIGDGLRIADMRIILIFMDFLLEDIVLEVIIGCYDDVFVGRGEIMVLSVLELLLAFVSRKHIVE